MNDNNRNNQKTFSVLKIFARIVKIFGWRILLGLSIAAGFLLFFGWLAEEVFEGDTRIFDETIRNFVHESASPLATSLVIFISFLGSPLFLIILGVTIIAAFSYFKLKRAMVLFLIAMAGEIVLEFALKLYFGRARPAAFFDYSLPASYSFPSGHAFGSLCFYGILAWLVTQKLKNRAAKTALFAGSAVLILLIGFSRVYLGVHYPSDVLAGYAAGLFWVGVVALTGAHLQHRQSDGE